MIYSEILQPDLPQPQPVEPDPCARIVARRGTYLSYLRRRISDMDTAEDLLQDFNLKVIQASRRTGTVHDTDAWLSRVLRNTLFDHYRRRDARRRADAAYAIEVTALSTSSSMEQDPAEAGGDDLKLTEIEAALARLRPDQAGLIRALYLHDQPRDHLARQLNVTIGTLNVRILRARHALRKALMDPSVKADATSPAAGSIADGLGSRYPEQDFSNA